MSPNPNDISLPKASERSLNEVTDYLPEQIYSVK